MSIDSVKRQIEGYKRDIDREKSRIADSRDDMAKIRIRKSRDADHYSRRLKSASSTAQQTQYTCSKEKRLGTLLPEKLKGKRNKLQKPEKKLKISVKKSSVQERE